MSLNAEVIGPNFFLLSPAKLHNPYDDYQFFLKNQRIYFEPELQMWFIFGHNENKELFKDNERLTSARLDGLVGAMPEKYKDELSQRFRHFADMLVFIDGDQQKRIRDSMRYAFTPKVIKAMGNRIEALTNQLLDKINPEKPFDIAKEFAHHLPIMVITEMLGLPPGEYIKIMQWADDIADLINTIPPEEHVIKHFISSIDEMKPYVMALIFNKKKNTGSDYLSELIIDNKLQDNELSANIFLLLLAGHETTRNFIGNTIYLLLTHPDQLAIVKQDKNKYPNLIHESLRYESVHPMMSRLVVTDFQYKDVTFKQGQMIQLCMGAANRDPDVFENPNNFDITRSKNFNMGFGAGPHTCLGAHLANMECEIAVKTLFERFPNCRLHQQDNIKWQHIANLRGPRSMILVME